MEMINEYSVQVVIRMPQYRTVGRSGTRLAGILVLAGLGLAHPARAQVTARLQGGLLTGVVQDQETGEPIRFALVILADPGARVFTAESGRFGIAGLRPDEYTLQVRQVGFAPVTIRLRLVREEFTPAPPPLVIGLQRMALVLPEILVTSTTCPDPRRQQHGPAAQAILEQAITNAERLLAMAHEYPLLARFERLRAGFSEADSVLWVRWDTLASMSDHVRGYRRGRVLVGGGLLPASVQYFTTSDIAGKEFRESHCLWVRGEEVLDSIRVVRIEFAPGERIRSPDWAGTLYLNAATGLLWRSEAVLTGLANDPGGLRSARCAVSYVEIVPTLVHEKGADCWLGLADGPETTRREVWGLLSWAFTGKVPGGG
jgi:hypothetical protein